MIDDDVSLGKATELRDQCGYLRLLRRAAREVGLAAQTLGALIELANRDTRATFAGLATIADVAGLPVRSARRHLALLEREGWIAKGDRTRARRTKLYTLTPKVDEAIRSDGWLALPNACRSWFGDKWNIRYVYVAIVNRHCMVEHLRANELDGHEHTRTSWLAAQTGVHRGAVSRAVKHLMDKGYIAGEGPYYEILDAPEPATQSAATRKSGGERRGHQDVAQRSGHVAQRSPRCSAEVIALTPIPLTQFNEPNTLKPTPARCAADAASVPAAAAHDSFSKIPKRELTEAETEANRRAFLAGLEKAAALVA